MFCDFSRNTFLSKGAMNHNLSYLNWILTVLEFSVQGPNCWVNCKLRKTGLEAQESCMLEFRGERNGANLNVCDWRISQHSSISDAQYLWSGLLQSVQPGEPTQMWASSPEVFWKRLIRAPQFSSCYRVTCLRVEVDSLWLISTLQKNLYFFPMENNALFSSALCHCHRCSQYCLGLQYLLGSCILEHSCKAFRMKKCELGFL